MYVWRVWSWRCDVIVDFVKLILCEEEDKEKEEELKELLQVDDLDTIKP